MVDQETILCPMTFNDTHAITSDCIQERCAWWNAEAQKCAMAVLAESARKKGRS